MVHSAEYVRALHELVEVPAPLECEMARWIRGHGTARSCLRCCLRWNSLFHRGGRALVAEDGEPVARYPVHWRAKGMLWLELQSRHRVTELVVEAGLLRPIRVFTHLPTREGPT